MSSTWPKLSPFSQANDQLLFVTFSSKIDYGLALINTGPSGAAARPALDGGDRSAQAAPGGDPSLPPFWLPFQDITEANHLPFWTALVACSNDGISYARCGDRRGVRGRRVQGRGGVKCACEKTLDA